MFGRAIGLWMVWAGLATAAVCQTNVRIAPSGLSVTVPGLPFEGERVTRVTRDLPDGSTMVKEEHERLARDADGRFYDESHVTAPVAEGNDRVFFLVVDPKAGRALNWSTLSRIATSFAVRAGSRVQVAALAADRDATPNLPKEKIGVVSEDLGSRVIAGVEAMGTRTTTIVPEGVVGNSKELSLKHEVWVSDDLQMVMSETDESPFTGTRKMEMVRLKRTSPAPRAFELPAGYTLRENAMTAAPAIAYMRALDELVQPETREKAADELVAYAAEHPAVQNHVAHVLAARETHLPDAERLARMSVERVERQTAAVAGSPITPGDLELANLLAEYWDSLGWVRYAQGDKDGAKRYCMAAWELGGEGLYIGHVARMAEEAGDKETARRLFQAGLGGKTDERERTQIERELAKLGVEKPQAADAVTVVQVERVAGAKGTAEVYLIFVANDKPRVRFRKDGDVGGLVGEAHALADAQYPMQLPDEGPEHVVRKGKLVCGDGGCRLTLLAAWQAVEAGSGR